MNELKEAMLEVAAIHGNNTIKNERHPLVICAEKWASHSTLTYDGKLLRKALKVSAAIMEFANALERINPSTYESDKGAADEMRKWVAEDKCPKCGGELDTGWECNSCGFDAQPLSPGQVTR